MTVDPRLDEEEARKEAAIGRAFGFSAAALAVVAAVGAGAWWLGRKPPVVAEAKIVARAVTGSRPRPQATPPLAPFADVTAEAGIDFVHYNSATEEKLLPETMGGGAAFIDFDQDGKPDILLTNGAPWPWHSQPPATPPTMKLYRNLGNGKFQDVTKAVGLDVAMYGTGVAIGDFDNDGWPDIFVSGCAPDRQGKTGPCRLFRNDRGKFTDVTAAAGVAGAPGDWCTSAGFADFDNDGKLDLLVLRYVDWSRELDKAQPFTLTGGGRGYGRPQDFGGAFAYLYRNLGNGKFEEISERAGLRIKNPVAQNRWLAKSLAFVPIDVDGDGWLDVVVANDTVQNFLFRNDRGKFAEIGIAAQVALDDRGLARGAMGIDAAHFRNDAAVGVAIGNFANEMTAFYVSQPPKQFFFVDEANSCGIGPQSRQYLKFGLFFFDFDLDGRLDLFEANGHLENEIERIQKLQTYAQPAQLFWNAGPRHADEFLDVPAAQCGDLKKPMVARAAAYADIDGDGDLDILVAAVGGPARLLRNDQQLGNHWLRLKLVGDGVRVNRDAIGATVEIVADGHAQRRAVMPCRSYQSAVELPVTFGFGKFAGPVSAAIRWPGGHVQKVEGLALDKLHTVKYDGPSR